MKENKNAIANDSLLGKVSLQQKIEAESISKHADIFLSYVTVPGDVAFRESTD